MIVHRRANSILRSQGFFLRLEKAQARNNFYHIHFGSASARSSALEGCINASSMLMRFESTISYHSGESAVKPLHRDEDFDEFDDEEVDPEVQVFVNATRSNYRRREKLPEWVLAQKHEIRQNRTMAQIRRCLKGWMIKAGRQNKRGPAFRERPLEWKETQKKLGVTRVSDGTLDVKAYGPEETIAYMHYFFPGKFSIHRRVFRDMTMFLGPSFKPKKILDFGCGPGTAAAAAIDVWGDNPDMLYSGVDMSRSMIDAADL